MVVVYYRKGEFARQQFTRPEQEKRTEGDVLREFFPVDVFVIFTRFADGYFFRIKDLFCEFCRDYYFYGAFNRFQVNCNNFVHNSQVDADVVVNNTIAKIFEEAPRYLRVFGFQVVTDF
jgi:hypothetical protein